MTKSFDDWYAEESPFKGNENNEDCKWASKFMQQAYEAGQQSRQKEIDELNLKINRLLESEENIARICEGWRDAHRELGERISDALNMLCKLQYSGGYRIYREVTRILNNK